MGGWARFRIGVCKSNEMEDKISEWKVCTAAQMYTKYLALPGLCSKEASVGLLVPTWVSRWCYGLSDLCLDLSSACIYLTVVDQNVYVNKECPSKMLTTAIVWHF